jgi:cell wall-associated NlpC family hydrolase
MYLQTSPHRGSEGWAVLALPPGSRDLACPDLWQRSLARSLRRRDRAAAARTPAVTRKRAVSAALVSATLLAPVTEVARAQQPTATGTLDTGNLHRGSRGPAVASAQRALGIPADGVFGPQTRRAVRGFQRDHALEVDGVAGPQTLGALGIPFTGYAAAGGSPGAGAGAAVSAARAAIGTPYVLAGAAPGGFDCSGLTQWAMRRAGIALPRTSYDQFGAGTAVAQAAIAPGDLVFFNTDGPGASHVGIATGAGSVISATTHGVREHAIADAYWGAHYVGARRVG